MPLRACIACGKPSPNTRCPEHELRNRPRGNTFEPTRQRILERDGWRCQECGTHLIPGRDQPNSAHVDHRIPLAHGGSDADENLQATCRTCNLRKSGG